MPSEALSDVKIGQRACTRAGLEPIVAFSDGTAEATVLNDNYDAVVDDAIASYPWNFATKYYTTARLPDTPPSDWGGYYTLPAECLDLSCVWINGYKATRWEVTAIGVLVDADTIDTVELQYVTRVDEAKFHPIFVEYVVYRLASMLASGVAHDANRAQLFQNQADRYYRRARWACGTEQTPRRLQATRLIARR